MYDIDREQRRNRILIAVSVGILLGVLLLIAFGQRGLVEWMLLATAAFSLRSTLHGRRALSLLEASLTDHDRAG